MRLFQRRPSKRIESFRLGELSQRLEDYPILTVGQSRLTESFETLGFTGAEQPRYCWSHLEPMTDPGLKIVADVQIRVEGQVVGYLRPPALDLAISVMVEQRARRLEIPVVLLSTPAGPEVRAHSSLL